MQKKILKFISENKLILFFIFCTLLGLWASAGLMIDQVNLLSNKSQFIECSINPLFSCTKVMNTKYASLFGFPNPILGLIGYTAMATFGLFLLTEKKLPKPYMYIALLLSFGAFAFSYFLILISVFKINTLCPLCLISAFSATNIFAIILYINFHHQHLSQRISSNSFAIKLFSSNIYLMLVLSWFVLVFLALYVKYPNILVF